MLAHVAVIMCWRRPRLGTPSNNCVPPYVAQLTRPGHVQATLTLATSIIEAAALSFLGLGDPDPARAEWGLMLGNAAREYLDVRPALAFYPAIAIIVVALGFTLLGESMREASIRRIGGDKHGSAGSSGPFGGIPAPRFAGIHRG